MVVYMCCTADKYELPLAVADTTVELAAITGTTSQRIFELIWQQRKRDENPKIKRRGKKANRIYFRVEIEDDDED